MPATTEIVDLGWDRIRAEIAKMDGAATKVGFPDGAEPAEGDRGSMTEVATIAAVHEFGAPKAYVPERSFLRTAHDDNLQALNALKERLYKKVVDGEMTTGQALEKLGEWMTGKVKKKIRDVMTPPLQRATVMRKSRSLRSKKKKRAAFITSGGNPLIDTGQMLNSVTHVEEGT